MEIPAKPGSEETQKSCSLNPEPWFARRFESLCTPHDRFASTSVVDRAYDDGIMMSVFVRANSDICLSLSVVSLFRLIS